MSLLVTLSSRVWESLLDLAPWVTVSSKTRRVLLVGQKNLLPAAKGLATTLVTAGRPKCLSFPQIKLMEPWAGSGARKIHCHSRDGYISGLNVGRTIVTIAKVLFGSGTSKLGHVLSFHVLNLLERVPRFSRPLPAQMTVLRPTRKLLRTRPCCFLF